MVPSDDIPQMFNSESQKLQNLIDAANSKTPMNTHEIVEIYYQVINVSSMITMLREQVDSNPNQISQIQETKNMISKKFDSVVHPAILAKLSFSIQEMTTNLRSVNSGEKSKEQTESNAKLFEELRQRMSTREFVEQYGKGL